MFYYEISKQNKSKKSSVDNKVAKTNYKPV